MTRLAKLTSRIMQLFTFIRLVNYLELSVIVLLVFSFKDGISEVLNTLPATGGDMGSHFWPLAVLKDYGFPNLTLRVWNPGNYAGEPLLVHYFPFPFLLMTVLSYLMPIGLAFNLVTFLPGILITPVIWWSATAIARGFGVTSEIARFTGAAAAVMSFGVFFNDGNTMWGGNIFSLLAGQFAHQWAFVCFFLWMGAFPKAVAYGGKSLLFGAMMLALVVISHGYVAIMMPVALLGLLFIPMGTLIDRIRNCFFMGLLGSMLSAWFWWPLIDNSKWTTPYGLSWGFEDFLKETLPREIAPSVIIAVLFLVMFLFKWKYLLTASRTLLFWSSQLIVGIASVPILASLGVVNVRTIPHVHYLLCFVAASLLATALFRERSSLWFSRSIILVSLALPFVQWNQIESSVNKSEGWINWNYSGWTNKPDYATLLKISAKIKGDFNDPRVVFEHDGNYNGAGTPRVFEMLPYFSGRSTTDGLYMQSTILAPHMFYNQAAISEKPSCPFPDFTCTPRDFDKAIATAPFLGIDTFILFSELTKAEARNRPELELLLYAPPWDVYRLKQTKVSYTETIRTLPVVTAESSWRAKFWEWFQTYEPGSPFLMRATDAQEWQAKVLVTKLDPDQICTPSTKVTYNRISISTNCPGKAHVLKFAYHDSWRSSGGEEIVLLSPGYMGIVPKTSEFELVFGQNPSWLLSGYVSFFAGLLFLLACMLQIKAIRRKILSLLSTIGIPTGWFEKPLDHGRYS